ncbi:MAG: 3,4-dihydroxy-2-butanone-4-phosphate synthase [Flavobacteriales bacterium]|jgi:3,4-dihydroxy 2-butanone 4-phosphate synthase/GTP cyclohydrolase II|nr:3,4-dihydroxy-2-butanone-4-phosphate synthase [Flavobacteriales bacterium]|tara:strand:+ start:125 stop:814 length:690 start_codon:yes stop_codon:yes gene_type:complete
MVFSKIEEAINDIKRGKFVIVVDDENRENEGDLVLAAEKATADRINYMIKNARGLVCMPIIRERLNQLGIPAMVDHNEINRCMFSISVDYRNGTTTGISPADRAATVKALIDDNIKSEDFALPGHMFPIMYKEGGVLVRQGHTEASVDLAKLAGLYPAAVICEVINDDGSMAKLPDLIEFSKKHNDMKIITIKDLIDYVNAQKSKSSTTNSAGNKEKLNKAEEKNLVYG